MSESLIVEGLEFALTRSRSRRTVGITVDRDGELRVAAPESAPSDQVEAVVRSKLFWVFAKLAEKALLFKPAPPKEFVSGEGFHYLGRSYRLLLTDDPCVTTPLRLVNGRFVLRRKDRHRAADLFANWYSDHASLWLSRRTTQLAERIGRRPKEVRVRDLANRWGSCTEDGVVYFHWRVIRLPPTVIEYVAAHELVHLLEPRHDAAFWNRLERAMPDYRQRKRALATHGGQY